MTTLTDYLHNEIDKAELRADAHTDVAHDMSLPPESRHYWQQQANEQVTRAETLRGVLRALDDIDSIA